MNKIVVYIKNIKVIIDDGTDRHTYTFSNHSDLENMVKYYWSDTLMKLSIRRLDNCRNNIDNIELDKIIKYKEKIRDKFLNAINKTKNTDKTARITIKEI